MNAVDIALAVGVVLFAWAGWRMGFVAAVMAFGGFLVGGIGGVFLAAEVVGRAGLEGSGSTLATAVCVLGLALVGQVVGSLLGQRIAAHIKWKAARVVDHLGGALLNVAGLVVIVWVLASAVAALPTAQVSGQIRESIIIPNVDRLIPGPVKSLVVQLRGVIDTTGLPQLFDSLDIVVPGDIEPPGVAIVGDPEVQDALGSVVRVVGDSRSCQRSFSGSGFVFAPGRVLTNAHVVAGVQHPRIDVPGSSTELDATPVYFDPDVDVAVLEVPGLRAEPIPIGEEAPRGTEAVIAGYPGGGPMTVTGARVRGTIPASSAQGTDIYGRHGVRREVYVLRGIARPGNSGGPLIDLDGDVIGVIFAQAQDDPDTAFALTSDQVEPAITAGRTATRPVPTGPCAA